jgi:hypothetical protein
MNGLYFWSQCILVHSNVVLWNFLQFFLQPQDYSAAVIAWSKAQPRTAMRIRPGRPVRERMMICLLSYHKINMLDNAFTNEQWHESKVGGC